MNRSSARRLVPLAIAGACLAGTALPAAAQTVSPDPQGFDVFVSQGVGSRLFEVQDMNNQPLQSLDFRAVQDGRMPFQTVVKDDAVRLTGPGYHVSAVMSNLYYINGDGTLDLTSKVRSSDLSIGYGRPLSAPVLELPVNPEVLLGGTIRPCSTEMLSLAALADPVLSVLCPLLGGSGVAVPTGTAVQDTATQVVNLADLVTANGGPLDLTKLPFPLTSQQQTGAFTNPARYAVSPYDDQVDGSQATTKRLMTGGPAAVDAIRGLIDAVLAGKLADSTLAVLPSGATPSLVPAQALKDALAAAPGLGDVMYQIGLLDAAQQDYLLDTVTGALTSVLADHLSTINARYVSNPVLIAKPAAARPGEYKGRLTVTFFQE